MEITEQEETNQIDEEEIDQEEQKRQKRVVKTRKMSLIAGIIGIVSIFIPYALASEGGAIQLIWQFGISLVFQPLGLDWAWFPIVAVGIFTTVFLTTGAVMLTVTAIKAKGREMAKFEVYWKTGGKLMLVSPILLLFYLVMRTDTYFQYYTYFIPFIGLVLPIISGVIAILTGRRAGKF